MFRAQTIQEFGWTPLMTENGKPFVSSKFKHRFEGRSINWDLMGCWMELYSQPTY
jgi:hypothetical protein